MKHSDLVNAAAAWLRKQNCSVILTELATTGETPDAIGWKGEHSILIECKTSRADFIGDSKKFFRLYPDFGVGLHRYFLTPKGMVKAEELPEKWGLLEFDAARITRTMIVRHSEAFDVTNTRQEVRMLLSVIRRIGQTPPKGISIRCYTLATKNTATVGIEQAEEKESS